MRTSSMLIGWLNRPTPSTSWNAPRLAQGRTPPVWSQVRVTVVLAILSSKSLRNQVRLKLWSLPVEFQYSAISPLTLVSGSRSGLPVHGRVPWPPKPVMPSNKSVVLGVL